MALTPEQIRELWKNHSPSKAGRKDMTHEEIIAMAREAGIEFQSHVGVLERINTTTSGSQSIKKIQRLIELAVAKEREACAQYMESCGRHGHAAAIRSRGQKDGCCATLSASSS